MGQKEFRRGPAQCDVEASSFLRAPSILSDLPNASIEILSVAKLCHRDREVDDAQENTRYTQDSFTQKAGSAAAMPAHTYQPGQLQSNMAPVKRPRMLTTRPHFAN
jgi:hypothetical protein